MAEVILLVGPPGAGKGTQAKYICNKLSIPHISTGDIFRAEVAAETELGLKVKAILDKGEYVSDEVVLDAVRSRLSKSDCDKGYLMDGFPRTLPQAEAFKQILDERGDVLKVIQLVVPEEQLIERINERASESGRSDDNTEVLKKRLQVYFKQTEPLIEYYQAEGVLNTVNGVGEIEEVSERIEQYL